MWFRENYTLLLGARIRLIDGTYSLPRYIPVYHSLYAASTYHNALHNYQELKSYPEAEEICQSVNSKLASTGVRNGDAKR